VVAKQTKNAPAAQAGRVGKEKLALPTETINLRVIHVRWFVCQKPKFEDSGDGAH
jgi:hypothetical protein